MKFFPNDPIVNLYNEGFETPDILQRKKVSAALSDLLGRIDDPIVVALDGKWGTGKTYFLKRWVGAHRIDNGNSATTVYFDAFANDYLSDPLPALVSALADRLPKEKKSQIEKAKAAAFKLAKPLARIGLAIGTYGATEVVSGVADAAVEAISKEAASGMQAYWAQEKARSIAIDDLRIAIESLADPKNEETIGASVVIVVDELDRCRPDYALEVLEVIKHFFSVPHLHFVLGVNLKALENSVLARYGEHIDAQAYLKKFIQLTLELPENFGGDFDNKSAPLIYLKHLIDEMGIPDHIGGRLQNRVEIVSRSNQISLRDIGKIAMSVNISSGDVLEPKNFNPGWIEVFVDLIISKVVRPDLYPKFLNASVSKDELRSYLGANERTLNRIIDDKPNPDYEHNVFYIYNIWLYLCQNGRLETDDSELQKAIGREFGPFGLRDDARKVPMKVHRDWLDQFSFYASE